MEYKFMQLLFKAMERRVVVSNAIHNGYESEWYHFVHSGWSYTIRFWWEEYTLSKDMLPQSKEYKEFKKILKDFLIVTFPK